MLRFGRCFEEARGTGIDVVNYPCRFLEHRLNYTLISGLYQLPVILLTSQALPLSVANRQAINDRGNRWFESLTAQARHSRIPYEL